MTCGSDVNETHRPAVEALIDETRFLPPAFDLVPRLLLLLDEPDLNCEALSDIIRVDAGLTVDVLQVANCARFGGFERIETLSEAINRIGLRQIYTIITTIVTAPAFQNSEAFSGQRVDLWRHSLATAIAAQVLTRHLTKQDPEQIFTAALLHDVGKVLLARAFGKDYSTVLEICAENGKSAYLSEKTAFGIDHLTAGSKLLRGWKFPDWLVHAIAHHHEPLNAPKESIQAASLVYAGNVMAYRIHQGNGYPTYSFQPDAPTLEAINVTRNDLNAYEEEIVELLKQEQDRLS